MPTRATPSRWVPPSIRGWTYRGVERRSRPRARLSVVVPVYDVEQYVEAALRSVLDQSCQDIEVVVVDDGSTDGSSAIVARVASTDERVTVIRQRNQGLGAARNTGIRSAHGEYLAFLDSDDLVEPGAFEQLIGSLERSGSDLAVASYRHLRNGRLYQPGRWINAAHAHDKTATTLSRDPGVLANAIVCSKVFRRTFWDRAALTFPEGIHYEDQVVSTLAYCRATSFDVLRIPLIRWRQREQATSITSQVRDPDNLRSRFDAAFSSLAVLEQHGFHDEHELRVVDYLANNTFTLNQLTHGDREYWDVLRAGVARLWAMASTTLIRDRVDTGDKVVYSLVLQDRQADALRFIDTGGRDIDRWAVGCDDGVLHTRAPLWGEPDRGVPDWCFEPARTQTALQAILTGVAWVSPTVLRVRGNAYVANAGEDDVPPTTTITLVDSARGLRLELPTTPWADPTARQRTRHQQIDYAPAGFEALIDTAKIRELLTRTEHSAARFALVARVRTAGLVRTDVIRKRAFMGSVRHPQTRIVDGSTLVRPRWSTHDGLALDVRSAPVRVVSGSSSGRSLTVDVRVGTGPFDPVRVVLTPHPATAAASSVEPIGPGLYRLHLEVPEAPTTREAYRVELVDRRGRIRLLHLDDPSTQLVQGADSPLLVDRNSACRLVIHDRSHVVEVEDLTRDGEDVLLTLTVPSRQPTRIGGRLVRGGDVITARPVEPSEGTAVLRFPGVRDGAPGQRPVAPRSGRYSIEVDAVSGDAREPLRLLVPDDVVARVPVETVSALSRASLRLARHSQLFVEFAPPIPSSQNSAFTRRQLVERYRSDDSPVVDGIYLQCLRGDQAADSQLALASAIEDRYPSMPVVWGLEDHSVPIPGRHRAVVIGTPDYFEALRTSRLLCFNHELPAYYEHRPEQVVVQTYHGHPFKSMGVHRWARGGVSARQIDQRLTARSAWDILLSPSATATRLYRENFPIDVRIAEVGHPRNDRLVRSTDAERVALRAGLGIAPDAVAVLYAPTYRDSATQNPWYAPLVEHLSAADLRAALGDGFVVLQRGHPANGRYSPDRAGGDGVIDVTFHHDVNDLIIASDIGVFDYSSIRFDYSVTGRPMVFLVPDKAEYFDHLPPLLDYDSTAPGPQVADLAELVTAVRDALAHPGSRHPTYDAFVRRFNHLDDGRAADRLLDVVMEVAQERAGTTGPARSRSVPSPSG